MNVIKKFLFGCAFLFGKTGTADAVVFHFAQFCHVGQQIQINMVFIADTNALGNAVPQKDRFLIGKFHV